MSRSADHAGMNIKNLHEKMARYGLKKEDFKEQQKAGKD
jgi:DNA-binding NtrC family response regulator